MSKFEGFRLAAGRKLLFQSIGETYGCTCYDDLHPLNRYHNPSCRSNYNMTFHIPLNLKQRALAKFMPTDRNLNINELKRLNIQV